MSLATFLLLNSLTAATLSFADPGSDKDRVRQAAEQLCAQTFDSKPSAARLEVSVCPECIGENLSASAGLSGTANQVRSLVGTLGAEEERARIKRELALFRSPFAVKFISKSASISSPASQLSKAENQLSLALASQRVERDRKEWSEKRLKVIRAASKGDVLDEEQVYIMNNLIKLNRKMAQEEIENSKEGILGSLQQHTSFKLDTDATSAGQGKSTLFNDPRKAIGQAYIQTEEKSLENLKRKRQLLENASVDSKDPEILKIFSGFSASVEPPSSFDAALESYAKQIASLEAEIRRIKDKIENHAKNSTFSNDVRELKSYEYQLLPELKATLKRTGYNSCGMSIIEAAALLNYTNIGYQLLNLALRKGGEEAKAAQPVVEVLNSALKKLRRYQGVVKRGTSVPNEQLAVFEVGKMISFPAYTSTSLTSGFSGNLKFVIHSKTGRFIGVHSGIQSENEVLIPPGAKFKVLDRKEGYDNVELVLEEVDPKIRPKSKGDAN